MRTLTIDSYSWYWYCYLLAVLVHQVEISVILLKRGHIFRVPFSTNPREPRRLLISRIPLSFRSFVHSLNTRSKSIPLQLTGPGQLSSECKRKFQSSYLPRIGPQEAVISTHYIIGFGPNWRGWHATEHILT
ncbi:unnamed protein product [Nezara viridula]|uniref:Uncharacterized protein n=1 Tax=Nezara viridula TaxID=85310 RepID=A0A9P0E2K1_NEZVI|nr:unnamed protein product [Nezara viridula]